MKQHKGPSIFDEWPATESDTWNRLADVHPELVDLADDALVAFEDGWTWQRWALLGLPRLDALHLDQNERQAAVEHLLAVLVSGTASGQHPPASDWGEQQ